MEVIDAFLAKDEVSLVNFRTEYLKKFVSHTYIGEASHTFSGSPKKAIFQDIYKNSPNVTVVQISIPQDMLQANNRWLIEEYQRDEFMRLVCQKHKHDILLFCDADEIPSLSQIHETKNYFVNGPREILSLVMPLYYRRANWLVAGETENWNKAKAFLGSMAMPGIRYKETPSTSNKDGSHLSYLGMGAEEIERKYSDFSHSELDNPSFSSQGLLKFADDFVVSHTGLFYSPGFGILKVIPSHELPSISKAALEYNSRWGGSKTKHNLLCRLTASRLISEFIKEQQTGSIDFPAIRLTNDFSLRQHLKTTYLYVTGLAREKLSTRK